MPRLAAHLPWCLLFLSSAALAQSFRYTQIDVGQGDSAVVIAPSGCAALLDGGPTGSGDTIKAYLRSIGVTQIDMAITSHHHADHIGGIDEVEQGSDGIPIAAVHDRGGSYSSTAFTQYANQFSGRRSTLTRGQVLWLCDEVRFEVVAVNGNGISTSDENTRSVVVKVSYGQLDALVGGDCTDACEATYAAGLGELELYKVHHHGSRTSSSDTLLDEIVPTNAFISCGWNNTYGHPTAEVISRLQAHGTEIWKTEDPAQEQAIGPIELSSANGDTYTVTQAGTTRSYSSKNPPVPDTAPPTAPGALTASAPGRGQISLSWSASTDNVGVAGYDVARSADGASFAPLASTTATSYQDSALPDGTAFWYRVTARDAAGNASAPSNTASATTVTPALAVTSPNGGESWAGGSTHDITWTSAHVASVKLEYSTDNGATWSVIASGAAASTGRHAWTLPGAATTAARVRATDAVYGGPADQSNGTFTITAGSPAKVILNEVLANEPGSSTAGEFVEVANVGGTGIGIGGWTLRVGGSTRHTFAAGTTLGAGQAIVVYGGASGIPPGVPNAVAASTGSLRLLNSGATVALRNGSGGTIDSMSYSSSLAGADGVSANRSPDATPGAGWALHTSLSSAGRSPGTRADGTPF